MSKRRGTRSLQSGLAGQRPGLSVRALHYYEEISLLWPSRRAEADHRLYPAGDVVRLKQIKLLRQLGLREQIKLQQKLCDHLGEWLQGACARQRFRSVFGREVGHSRLGQGVGLPLPRARGHSGDCAPDNGP